MKFQNPTSATILSAHKNIGEIKYVRLEAEGVLTHQFQSTGDGVQPEAVFGVRHTPDVPSVYFYSATLDDAISRSGTYKERPIQEGYIITNEKCSHEAFAILFGPKIKLFEGREYENPGAGDDVIFRVATCWGSVPSAIHQCLQRKATKACGSPTYTINEVVTGPNESHPRNGQPLEGTMDFTCVGDR